MAAKNYIKVALVTLLTLALVICAMPCVLATDTVAETSGAEDVLLMAPAADSDTVADADTDAPVESAAESDTETQGEETAPESGEGTDTAEAGADSDSEGTDTAATGENIINIDDVSDKGGISTGTIISIAIVAVIVIFAAVYCIKNREKVAKFFREVRSECKKIVWTPWKTVRKNTFVVIVIMIICAIVIGVLDVLFSRGILALGNIL